MAMGVPQTPADLPAHQVIIYEQRPGGSTSAFCKGATETAVTVKGRLRVSAAEGMREGVLAGPASPSPPVLQDWMLPAIDLASSRRST